MRADKQRNKDKILRKAEELLSGSNIDTISLEEIALGAEVTRATLYNHFSSKEDLLKELVLPALRSITNDLKERNSKEAGSFANVTESLFNLYRQYRQTLELVACRTLYGNDDVAEAHRLFMVQFRQTMNRAGAEEFPLGMDLSLRLISATYLQVLSELQKADRLEFPLFHRIMEGVINL